MLLYGGISLEKQRAEHFAESPGRGRAGAPEEGACGVAAAHRAARRDVATGAFCEYFPSKEALFDALVVEPPLCSSIASGRRRQGLQNCPHTNNRSNGQDLRRLRGLDGGSCIPQSRCVPAAAVLRARGTKPRSTTWQRSRPGAHGIIAVLRAPGRDVPQLDPQFEHIAISGRFAGFLRWSFTICRWSGCGHVAALPGGRFAGRERSQSGSGGRAVPAHGGAADRGGRSWTLGGAQAELASA